jgi:hypothetical protein
LLVKEMSHQYLPLSVVQDVERFADILGVSQVARSQRGFLTAYKRAGGNPDRLSDEWADKREAFLARHLAQVKKRGEPLWKGGEPTRRHLALIMWAYSPTPQRIDNWLDQMSV